MVEHALFFWGGREIMAKCAFNISLLSFLFVPFHSFPVSFLFSFCIFHLPSAFLLSSAKCISIFHLPPFSIFLSDYHLVNRVEDRVFSPFIFHLYLPSSTYCFKAKRCTGHWLSITNHAFPKQTHLLKHFVFLSCSTGNGAIYIWSQAGVPMGPCTRDHEPAYLGLWARVPGPG